MRSPEGPLHLPGQGVAPPKGGVPRPKGVGAGQDLPDQGLTSQIPRPEPAQPGKNAFRL